MTQRSNTLPKHERLRAPQFNAIFARRQSVADERLTLFALHNKLAYSRVGVAAPRRLGPAAQRNRFKRLLREAWRLTKAELPVGLDVVLMPRSGEPWNLEDYRASLRQLAPRVLRKLGPQEKQA